MKKHLHRCWAAAETAGKYQQDPCRDQGRSSDSKQDRRDRSRAEHDIAIVYGAKTTYILCVMSEGWKSGGDAVQNIQNISSMVYNYLNL